MPPINFKPLFFIMLIGGAFLIGFLAFVNPRLFHQAAGRPYLIINGQKILIELADTREKRTRGLSGREVLAENEGILFIFPQPGNYIFWMKDMKFNLDFVFMKDRKVVEVVEDVPFPKENQSPAVVNSKAQFDQVLEINAGLIKEYGIKIGAAINLNS